MSHNQFTVSNLIHFLGASCLLKATAPGLEGKLGKIAPAHAVAGHIAPYFVDRSVAVNFNYIVLFVWVGGGKWGLCLLAFS